MYTPSYIALYDSGELKKRVDSMNDRLSSCDICPRKCGVDRKSGQNGYCHSGFGIDISSYCDHHGEEPALSGIKGSGTIFFSHCNLKCVFCQNHQISQDNSAPAEHFDSYDLAGIMIYLQDKLGCHNINLVSPTHYVPQILSALYTAIPMGLKIPLVYNTNSYDTIATLQQLDGIIDIYLPDIKYAADQYAQRFSDAKDYVYHCRAAIKEMYRQTGELITDESGIATRGLIVRHLILPNDLAGSKDSLNWIARNLSTKVTLSIMAQYYPCHKAVKEPLLSRRITSQEYLDIVDVLDNLNMENGWLQQMNSSDHYLPDFKRQGHPFEQL